MSTDAPFPYSGPEALRQPIIDALMLVVDPEVALSIVDVGLVLGVTVSVDRLHVLLTMTSAACPVAGMIIEEVEAELASVALRGMAIDVELVWEPPWTPAQMSERARRLMQW